jgi:tetratricopeptide (TPR) repeat protein
VLPGRIRRLLSSAAVAVPLLLPPGAALAAGDTGGAASQEKPNVERRLTKRQQREEERRKEEERLQYALQPRVSEAFGKVQEDLAAERYARAERALRKLLRTKLSPFERAQAERLHGYASYGRKDNTAALEHLTKALAENALPSTDQADVLFQVAQIHAVEKRWKDVITTLGRWFETVEKPNSVGYYLMALSHFQLGDLEGALPHARQAVAIAQKPQQGWLQLLLAIHLTRKEYASATPVLEQLISNHPDAGKGYWLQLSALYGVNENNEKALAVMELAYRKGILDEEQDLIRLAQLNLLQGIPQRAAKILETELAAGRIRENVEAFELLSGSWILAREVDEAEGPLMRAAELAPKGNLYVRLAQVHMMQEEWGEAADSLHKAFAKGGLDDPATGELLLGITYFNANELREARSWFARAQRSVATRHQAQTWLEHIDREIETRPAAEVAG